MNFIIENISWVYEYTTWFDGEMMEGFCERLDVMEGFCERLDVLEKENGREMVDVYETLLNYSLNLQLYFDNFDNSLSHVIHF